MKKALKLLFSQTAVVALLMLLQLATLVTTLWRLSQYSAYINAALLVLSLLVVLRVVSSHTNPSFQLAWVILILGFPVFGGLFYLFIYSQQHSRRYLRQLEQQWRWLSVQLPEDTAARDAWAAQYPEDTRTLHYLAQMGYRPCGGTQATYLSPGEDWGRAMLEDLRQARRYIYLEFFILEDGQLWQEILSILRERAAAGVDVRLLYDGLGSVNLPRTFPRQMADMGIHCKVFNPFRPFLTAVQNHRDHRKICVIDGRVAYTGGANLSDEYVNLTHPYGHWKDAMLRVQGDSAPVLAAMFLSMWQLTEAENAPAPAFLPEPPAPVPANGLALPFCDNPLSARRVGETVYLHAIRSARQYLHICTPYLILDHTMTRDLEMAAQSGVDVTVVIPSVADHWYAYAVAKAFCARLLAAGVKIYTYTPGFIHSKTFVWDGAGAVVGSVNLDFRSLYTHFEAGVWLRGGEAVAQTEEDFQAILRVSDPMHPEDCKPKGLLKGLLYGLLRLFAPLM